MRSSEGSVSPSKEKQLLREAGRSDDGTLTGEHASEDSLSLVLLTDIYIYAYNVFTYIDVLI